MTRTSSILGLALLSSLLTPVVVSATGMAAKEPASAQQAASATAPATAAVATEAAPACAARKVKVIYAGYGEGQSCADAAR